MNSSFIENITAFIGSISYNDYSYNKIEISFTNFSKLKSYGEAFFYETLNYLKLDSCKFIGFF